jgi:hypothetical protein
VCTFSDRGRIGSRQVSPGLQCPGLNSFKLVKSIQTLFNINFKLVQNLTDPKSTFSCSKKTKIKYSFDGFEERNNFLHRNFFNFEMDFE